MPRRPAPRALGRRAVLGGVVATGLTASGCTLDSLRGNGDTPPPAPSGSARPAPTMTPTAPAVDADRRVVERARHDLAAAHQVVTAAAGAFPGLRRDLAPLARLHERHAKDLGGLPRLTGGPAPSSSTEAAAQVGAAEKHLERRLAEAAARASSGTLAARLASMTAAVAQQRATSPVLAPAASTADSPADS